MGLGSGCTALLEAANEELYLRADPHAPHPSWVLATTRNLLFEASSSSVRSITPSSRKVGVACSCGLIMYSSALSMMCCEESPSWLLVSVSLSRTCRMPPATLVRTSMVRSRCSRCSELTLTTDPKELLGVYISDIAAPQSRGKVEQLKELLLLGRWAPGWDS